MNPSLHQAPKVILALALLLAGPAAGAERPQRGEPDRGFDARVELNRTFRAAPSPMQARALRHLAQAVTDLAFEQDPTTGGVRALSSHGGYLTSPGAGDPADIGIAFVREHGSALGLDSLDLEHGPPERVVSALTGATRVFLQQGHAGLPVYGAHLQVNVNREGRILSINNAFLPGLRRAVNTVHPRIALAAAIRAAAGSPVPNASDGRLMLLPVRQGMARLVWSFRLRTSAGEFDLTVDAVTGKVWTRFERARAPLGASCLANPRQPPGELRARWTLLTSRVAARLAADWGTAPDSSDPAGSAGNERMLLYLEEGLGNAGCAPTLAQMRDGLIQAAADAHDGEDVCRLWEVFAASGLGTNAVGGGPQGFELPVACGGRGTRPAKGSSRSGRAAAASRDRDDAPTADAAPVLAAATGGAGASLPYVELQAENAATNGTVIGPSFIYNQLACEASGRKAVTLAGQGKFVEFTLPTAANSIVVRYSIPDTAGGSVYTVPLSLYINGVKQPNLILTNAYSWFYGGYPFTNSPGSNPHHFYDEVHRLLPSMAAGTRVRLQVDPEDTASSYTIDLADFEQVGPPRAQPANSVSVTSFGADPTGANDSTAAFNSAVANAAGRIVFIPSGTFRVNGHVIVNNVTIQGAGMWYSVVTGQDIGFYGNFPPAPSTNVHLSHFEIRGNVQERNDGAAVNGIGGALQNSTVSDVWIEHTKVGAWVDGPFNNLTLTRVRIRNQTADAINFHNGVTGSSVTQSHFRNLGDDGLAMWSEHNPDANNSFTFNTVELPILANGIAIYGGRDITVSDNRVVDAGLSQGGGIHVGNRFAATPVGGVIQVRRNTIVRSGDLDPNWQFGVGALWFDARDQAMTGQITVDDILIQQSPYEAIQFISGSSITNVSISNATITGTGTFVLQLQVGGSATFTNVVATGVNGPAGIYSCGVPFTVIDGGGNSGWQTTFCGPWPNPIFPPPVGVSASPTALSFGAQTVGTTSGAQSVLVTNSASSAAAITSIGVTGDFAQTSNCGTSLAAGASCTVSVTFRPGAAGTRTGTLTIESNAGNSSVSLTGTGTAPGPALSATPSSLSFAAAVVGTTSSAQSVSLQNTGTAAASISSIVASGDFAQTSTCGASLGVGASCTVSVTFRPTASGNRTGALTITSNAVNSPTTVALSGSAVSSTTNVALGKPTTASSSVNGALTPNLAVDGNASSYWESANNAFPQWLQVDIGSVLSIGRVVIKLPPPAAWATRTQTLSIAGSTDGGAFTTLVPSAGYTFNPATGNTVTITFGATSQRYVRLNFTANTGWPAGQASELEVYPAAAGTPGELTVSPSSLSFASRAVGSTSPAQAVTLRNPGSSAASATISSISASGDFAQTNTCGTSLAGGASCTINVTFRPTAAGTRTGAVTIASSAPGSPTTVSLSGTGVASGTNLALGKVMSASSSVNGSFTPNFANDDNPSSYWESANGAFPQWLQVDLGAPTDVGRIVIKLPPSTSWGPRTQTLSVTGSTDGSTFTTIVGSTGYGFNAATGNSVTITFAGTSRRFLRLTFTANTGWPAGQASELQVFAP